MNLASLERRVAKLEEANERRLDEIWTLAKGRYLTEEERDRVSRHEARRGNGEIATADELAWYDELKMHAVNEYHYRRRPGYVMHFPPYHKDWRKHLAAMPRWSYLTPKSS
jgi:hypothetical protein